MTKKQGILREVNGISVEQRVVDGFINATAMCVAHGKDVSDWLKTDETWDLVVALADDLGFEPNSDKKPNSDKTRVSAVYPSLVVVKRGAPETGGGTWLHPDLAIQLAQWCNKLFAIQVSRWIREWMTTGKNPIETQSDIDRLVYRTTLKDESRLRATGQVKSYLVSENKYDDKKFTGQFYVQFHDAINIAITGEPAWKMKLTLSKIHGRKFGKDDLIRDYFPPIQLQQYIAINEAASNIMRKNRDIHPLTAVEMAAELILPHGYIPSPIDFVEHINLVRQRLSQPLLGQSNQQFLP
jgi:KilA-N domain